MNISKKYILTIFLILLCMFSFAACNLDRKNKLTMSELAYDETTKTVSWDKVSNALGYELKIDNGAYAATGITESSNKMQYIISQSAGTYTVYVVAKGDGTNYSDSEVKSINITINGQSAGDNQEIVQTLQNTRLDLTRAKSVGLVKRRDMSTVSVNSASLITLTDSKESVKDNVLVIIDEENSVDDATYKKTEADVESEVEVKSWYVRNLKVTDNFIFIYYVNYECNIVVDKFSSASENDQSFAINKSTGKVYPLSELPDIDMIIESGDFLRNNNKFYKATIENDELRLTKLSSNDNIKEYFAMEDKWGNIFVQNDSIHEQKLSNLFYYKDEYEVFYGLGDDGVIYKTYIMYNASSNTRVEYFNQNIQSVLVTTPISVAVRSVKDSYGLGLIKTSYFIFNGPNCFFIDNTYSSFVLLEGIQWKSDHFGYTGYTGTWGIYYKGTAFYENVYFIDGQIVVATETELAHFDISSYDGWTTEQLTKVANYNSAELKGGILIITTEGIQGVTVSFVYVQDGQVKTELLAEVFYDVEIITILPLN